MAEVPFEFTWWSGGMIDAKKETSFWGHGIAS
jgi:hypothetical protein